MERPEFRFVDLFCGIGGFHYAARAAADETRCRARCVLAADIDPACRLQYEANFQQAPVGDIRALEAGQVPNHDLLFAGFPCQPFSIIGDRRGFDDTRGTLFFEIARIIAEKRPRAFLLENVKQLRGHNGGATLDRILQVLRSDLGYRVDWKVLNALDFGLPQKRERILIVGFRDDLAFEWPTGHTSMTPLEAILESDVPRRHYASDYIRSARAKWHEPEERRTIWHENKSGNVSKYPFSCALRAGASHNYLLVDGVRRLTEREMLRLQGFPDEFIVLGSHSTLRRQAGNAVPVTMVSEVVKRMMVALQATVVGRPRQTADIG